MDEPSTSTSSSSTPRVPPIYTFRKRLRKELDKLNTEPPRGISCHVREGSANILDASIVGVAGTPYESGIFDLEVIIPDRYPFEPPIVHFMTKIYHPNIDECGKICLNTLQLPPLGAWSCALTIEKTLLGIQSLLSSPNVDDPLMLEIAHQYINERSLFNEKAIEWTKLYCRGCETTTTIVSQIVDNDQLPQASSNP